MLSTRKPEEPNFNFNHVRGLQEAFGEPPWTGPGPWARGPGPSWSKHRHEIRVTGSPTPTHTIPGRAKKRGPLPACPPVGVIGLSSIGGISGGHHRPRLA